MSLDKVLKLYFHYRNTGNITKMAEILHDYNPDKVYNLLNKFKKMKNGIDSLIESFQQLDEKTMQRFFFRFKEEKNK